MKDASVDVAMLSQALHHAHDPARAVAEAARVTTPGGRVLLLDLRAHDEEWVRAKLGDRRLGFADDELRRMLTAAGLADVKVGVGARKAGDPFTVLVASGTKAAAKHAKDTQTHESHDTQRTRAARRPPRQADPRPRRRDGDDGPAPPADGSRLPRRAVRGHPQRSARQQRRAGADPAGRHRRNPPPVSRGRQRHHRDQHLQQHRDRAGATTGSSRWSTS